MPQSLYQDQTDAAEEEFGASARRQTIALFAGPAVALVVYLLPLPLAAGAHALATILSCVVLYWITEPIPLPVTALLGTALCVLAGLGSAKSIFASYGHPIIFLFIGSFLLAEAMAVHGVDRRVAGWILSFSWVRDRPMRILLMLGTTTAVISMWISNTAATAMMLPIGMGVLSTLEDPARPAHRYRIGLMLMLSYAAAAGGTATIIGTPPNLIGAGFIAQQTGFTMSFVTWLAFGIPLACLMLLTAWGLLLWLYPADSFMAHEPRPDHAPEHVAPEPWTRGQVNACVAFSLAVAMWIGPGLLGAILGHEHRLSVWLEDHLPNELVALLAAGLLFVLPAERGRHAPTLSWKQAANINWGIILLFGGGLAFGHLMQGTGLSDAVGQGFVNLFGMEAVWSLTAVSIIASVLVSELASNTASASMLVPLVIAIAQTSGVAAVPPALGACLGASLGFALPVSTPPNAIVYGTGMVPMKSMIRTGILFDFLGAILIWLVLLIVCPLIGLI